MNKPTDFPAFPNTDPAYFGAKFSEGMTLRDYFAAKAMQAYITKNALFSSDPQELSARSYHIADAMLTEREKGGEDAND